MKSYLISESALMEEITEGQCIVYDCNYGQFYEMNKEAMFILKSFCKECTIDDIVQCIKTVVQTESFDQKRVQHQVEQFVQKCLERNLLKEVDG